MKSFKKVISIILTVIMAVSVFAAMPVSAEETETVYTQVNLAPYANGRFWVQEGTDEQAVEPYETVDFISAGSSLSTKAAAKWPLTFATSRQTGAPSQAATIATVDETTATVTSSNTGIVYNMPQKRALDLDDETGKTGNKEAIVLTVSPESYPTVPNTKTVKLGSRYNSIHFLVASSTNDISTGNIYATVTYSDGTIAELNGGNGKTVPGGIAAQQSASDNFVAEIETLGCDSYWATSGGKTPYSRWIVLNTYPTHFMTSLYEYSITLDNEKVASEITFTLENTAAYTTSVAITSITGTKTARKKNYYTTYDLSANGANGKFWVDKTVADELNVSHYSGAGWDANGYSVDFVAAGGGLGYSLKAAKYPIEINYDTTDKIPDKAWAMSDNSLRSPSGIPYMLPEKTETSSEKEVLTLSVNTAGTQGHVQIGTKNVKKVHFLVAAALGIDMTFSVQPVYETAGDSVPATTFTVTGTGNIASDEKALCELNSLETTGLRTSFDPNGGGAWGGDLIVREYTLEVNASDKLRYITFKPVSTYVSNRVGSLAIIAVTTEDASGTKSASLASTSATVADGSYTVTASAPITGTAILAVYNEAGDKLIAVGKSDLENNDHTRTITAESENITADGTYTAKVMLWDDVTDSFMPLTSAVTVD